MSRLRKIGMNIAPKLRERDAMADETQKRAQRIHAENPKNPVLPAVS